MQKTGSFSLGGEKPLNLVKPVFNVVFLFVTASSLSTVYIREPL